MGAYYFAEMGAYYFAEMGAYYFAEMGARSRLPKPNCRGPL